MNNYTNDFAHIFTTENIRKVEEYLGYEFSNKCLAVQAFIHSSFSDTVNNEMLEFVGDCALELAVTKYLVKNHSHFDTFFNEDGLSEGTFTELRANLVCGSELASIIERSGLNELIITGGSDKFNTVKYQDSVMENLFEALIGAVTLDCEWDMNVVCGVVEHIHDLENCCEEYFSDDKYSDSLESRYSAIGDKLIPKFPFALNDSVNRIQELMQIKLIENVEYTEPKSRYDVSGNSVWSCECRILVTEDESVCYCAAASTKVTAKKIAALKALLHILVKSVSVKAARGESEWSELADELNNTHLPLTSEAEHLLNKIEETVVRIREKEAEEKRQNAYWKV